MSHIKQLGLTRRQRALVQLTEPEAFWLSRLRTLSGRHKIPAELHAKLAHLKLSSPDGPRLTAKGMIEVIKRQI